MTVNKFFRAYLLTFLKTLKATSFLSHLLFFICFLLHWFLQLSDESDHSFQILSMVSLREEFGIQARKYLNRKFTEIYNMDHWFPLLPWQPPSCCTCSFLFAFCFIDFCSCQMTQNIAFLSNTFLLVCQILFLN